MQQSPHALKNGVPLCLLKAHMGSCGPSSAPRGEKQSGQSPGYLSLHQPQRPPPLPLTGIPDLRAYS